MRVLGLVRHTNLSSPGRGAEMLSYGDAVYALTHRVSVLDHKGHHWRVIKVEDRGMRSWRVTLARLETGRTEQFDLPLDAKLSHARLP